MQNFDLKQLAKDWNQLFNDLLELKTRQPLVPYQPTPAYQNRDLSHNMDLKAEVRQEYRSQEKVPAISLALTTMRVGGLDVLFNSLSKQTFQDFEVIVVDGIYQYRQDKIQEQLKKYSFPIKYVKPMKDVFPESSLASATNTALSYCAAPVVLLLTDYTYLPSDCVEKHVKFHQEHPEVNQGYMCPHQYRSLPTLNTQFHGYQNEETDQYVSDLKDHKLDNCMWSIFESDFAEDPENLPLDSMGNSDNKLFAPYGKGDQNAFNGKNESLKMQAILQVNGWDEELDGAHLCQDNSFADSLSKRLNFEWTVDKDNKVYIINPRFVMPHAKRIRHHLTNYPIWRKKEANLFVDPINSWSLKHQRNINLHGFSQKIKLNLGCGNGTAGLNVLTMDHRNWKHIDIVPEFHPTECYDIGDGIRETDNSVSEIFMGDFFEHLYRTQALKVIKDCFRVLEPGGKITICVPDMEVGMKRFLASGGEDIGDAQLVWGQQDPSNAWADTHKFGYTENSLTKLLKNTGFSIVKRIALHKNYFELTIEAIK